MVFEVDDWIETRAGDIGLVVDTSRVKRSGGEVAVYLPYLVEVIDVPTGEVAAKFLNVLAPRASL